MSVLAALVGVAFGAGIVVGGVGEGGPGNVPEKGSPGLPSERVPIERADAKAGGRNGTIIYYETTDPLPPIPPGPGGYIFDKCPKGSAAVNGYYYKTIPDPGNPEETVGYFKGFGLDDQGSSPAGYRKWAFYWDNVTVAEITGVYVGIVCDREG